MKRKNFKITLLFFILFSQNIFAYQINNPQPTWKNNVVKWWYNPTDSPYSEEDSLAFIKEASQSWENVSGVKFEYQGITTLNQFDLNDGKVVFGWAKHGVIDDSDKFGGNGCIGAFVQYNNGNKGTVITDASLTLNRDRDRQTDDRYCFNTTIPNSNPLKKYSPISSWKGLITHELGHVLALEHSSECESSMAGSSYADENGKVHFTGCKYKGTTYQETLRQDDINGIQSLYPLNPCVGFRDVKESDSICSELTFAKESEWVNGYPNGTFRPNQEVNRAEFTKIVMNASYKKSLKSKDCFYDNSKGEYEIKSDKWYASYICTAKDNDIIKGKGDGLFHPDDKVNYVESLKITLKALGFKANEDEYSNWYTPYVDEANAMGLPTYDVTHIMTRGEMISLIHDAYSKHTQRALATNSWKQSCHAKNYHFYKLGRTPTCQEKWAMQIFYELGIPNLNTQSSLVKTAMRDIQDTHDIAMSTFKQISAVVNLGGSGQDGLIPFQLESIKTLSGVAFDKQGGDIANVTGMIFDIGISVMQESINEIKKTKPSPLLYISFASKIGEIGTDVFGAYSLNEKTKALNNLNIAIAYLNDFYQYGGDNGKVAVNEAKINADANMYDTIWHYATNKGYKNSWWSDEFDFSKTVDIVEEIKRDVNRAVQICYIEGQCLSQKQKEPLTNFDIFTINGNQSIKY